METTGLETLTVNKVGKMYGERRKRRRRLLLLLFEKYFRRAMSVTQRDRLRYQKRFGVTIHTAIKQKHLSW